MNKYKLYMILSISILILSISGTLAWYVWTSTTNAIVNLDICTPTITFAGGSTINGTNMIPVLTKDEGLTKEITFNLNSKCNKKVDMSLYLSLDNFPNELADETFVYELYLGDTQINYGNFAYKSEGDTITLIENSNLTENKTSYRLYIYINGNLDNNADMAGKIFRFSLYAKGNNAIFGENIISSNTFTSDKDSTFLNIDNLERTSIETIDIIEITEDTLVPNSAVDISSLSDKSIMLWYDTSENNDSLYKVTIGSTSGTIKLNTTAKYMFSYLKNLIELNGLNKLDTSEVTDMFGMFNNCNKITSLDLSNFNTSKVTTMLIMFQKLKEIKEIDLSSFDTSKVTNMSQMFRGSDNLVSLDLSGFDTSSLETMIGMFYECSSLKSLDLSSFNTSKVTDMSYMTWKCSSLENIIFGDNFNTSKVTTMYGMFRGCSNLTELDLSTFDTRNVTVMTLMFYECSSLKSLDLSAFDTNEVTGMEEMFQGCSSLENIIFGDNFNTSNVTSMLQMFYYCNSLKSLDLSNFNTSNVTSMLQMFYYCNSLKSLDLSNFNTSKVTNMASMFYHCNNLTTIYVSDLWNIDNVTNSENMFTYSYLLPGYNSSNVDKSMANYTTGYLTYKANTNT